MGLIIISDFPLGLHQRVYLYFELRNLVFWKSQVSGLPVNMPASRRTRSPVRQIPG